MRDRDGWAIKEIPGQAFKPPRAAEIPHPLLDYQDERHRRGVGFHAHSGSGLVQSMAIGKTSLASDAVVGVMESVKERPFQPFPEGQLEVRW